VAVRVLRQGTLRKCSKAIAMHTCKAQLLKCLAQSVGGRSEYAKRAVIASRRSIGTRVVANKGERVTAPNNRSPSMQLPQSSLAEERVYKIFGEVAIHEPPTIKLPFRTGGMEAFIQRTR
jgi:hypothetical protein